MSAKASSGTDFVVIQWNVGKISWSERFWLGDNLDVWFHDGDFLLLQEVFLGHGIHKGHFDSEGHRCFYVPGADGIHGVAIWVNRRWVQCVVMILLLTLGPTMVKQFLTNSW